MKEFITKPKKLECLESNTKHIIPRGKFKIIGTGTGLVELKVISSIGFISSVMLDVDEFNQLSNLITEEFKNEKLNSAYFNTEK